MQKKTECFATSDSLSGVKYEKAVGMSINLRATTTPPSGHLRTVVTTAQHGWLDLRYVPRDPKFTDKNTAY